jgi:hypothetical protein
VGGVIPGTEVCSSLGAMFHEHAYSVARLCTAKSCKDLLEGLEKFILEKMSHKVGYKVVEFHRFKRLSKLSDLESQPLYALKDY